MSDPVQQIKDRLNIVDVVSAYVELHKAGRHFKGKSPFTSEKTPSFYVSPDRGMYYCFSTSQGGDMFTFVEAMEGVDFKGALKILAEKANVELVPVSPQKKSERDRLYVVMEEATNFYVTRLQNAKAAKKYLEERGVNEASLESWRIGFAPGPPDDGWREVKDHLLMKGYTEAELFKAGLVKESGKGKDAYDVFRNRIMFPLFDQGGRVVGFSGRTLESGPEIPKYVNSPETELYKKSELLYGYDRARKGIRNLNFSLIVEGQFDVVMSHQSGYTNTVAVSGTALTPLHVQLLERLSTKVVLALDSDKAGVAAVKRAADLMLRRGLDVKVAALPKGQDPADIVLKDIKEYKQAIGKSLHVIEFLLQHLKERNLDERTFKLQAREEILPYINLLPNHIDQDHFEAKLAEALNTTKEAVHYEVERLNENKERASNTKEVTNKPVVKKPAVEQLPQQRMTALLAYVVSAYTLFDSDISSKLKALIEAITSKTIEELDSTISPGTKAEVLFRAESFLDKNPRKVFDDEFIHSLNELRAQTIKNEINRARKQLEEAESMGQEDKITEAIQLVSLLRQKLQENPYTVELLEEKQ